MTSTLIPRDTLMASLIAKSAAAADAETKPTAAQEAIANADAYLQNAVLPTYTELLAALRAITKEIGPGFDQGWPGTLSTIYGTAAPLLARHDKTIAGNFGA